MSSSNVKAGKKSSRYHHGDLRRALVSAAREVLREGGTGKLSLRAAARRAGVSHASAYYHFEDKTSLVAAVAIQAFNELGEATDAVYEQGGRSTLERLKAVASAYVRFALSNPQEFRVMFLPELRSDAVRTEVEQAGRAGYERTVALIVAELQAEGRIAEGRPGRGGDQRLGHDARSGDLDDRWAALPQRPHRGGARGCSSRARLSICCLGCSSRVGSSELVDVGRLYRVFAHPLLR